MNNFTSIQAFLIIRHGTMETYMLSGGECSCIIDFLTSAVEGYEWSVSCFNE